MASVMGVNLGTISFGWWTVIIIFGLIFFGLLVWLFIWYKKYNRVVIVKKMIANGQHKIIFDKCRYLKDKEGVEWFKFLKLRKKVRLPPSESIELMSNGKEFLYCYSAETGEISWARDNTKELSGIEPFTTEDRQVLQYQFYKAHLEGGISWKDLIIPIFGIIALVIITVSLMIFYKDMGEPLLAMGKQLEGFQAQQVKMMEQMNVMLERLCSSGYGNCTQVLSGNTAVRVAPS